MQIIRNTKKKKKLGHNRITVSIKYYGHGDKTGICCH